MKKLLLSIFAVGITATAFASPSAPAVRLNESGAFAPQIRETEGFTFCPVDRNKLETSAQQRVTRAEGDVMSLDFTLAYEPAGALYFNGLSVGSKYYQAFELSSANRGRYAGMKITSINIVSPFNGRLSSGNNYVNDITDVKVFLTHDLQGESFYEQNGQLGEVGLEWNKIVLDEPYVIESDKPLYIGYYAKIKSSSDSYIVVDGVPRASLEGGYCAYSQNSEAPKWDNLAQSYGNLCIGATIEGENLPVDGVSIYGINLPSYVDLGKPFSFDIGFVGAAANNAESVELEYTVGDQTPGTVTIPFEEPLGYSRTIAYTINDLVCNQTGGAVPFSVKVTKVNGNPNISEENVATSELLCFDSKLGYKHTFVVEEGTGVQCGWCPRGIAMMEYLKKNYPNEFIRVAIHGNIPGKDPMTVSSTSTVINTLFTSGFPSALVDRTYDCMLGYTGVDVNGELIKYYEANKDIPSMADVDLEVEVESGAKKINIPTTVKFALDADNNNRYRLAYYIIENNVGPYNQANFYAGGDMGECGGWEDKDESVSMMYEDVVRRLVGTVSGVSGSIPTEIKAGETYNYTGAASIANVTNDEFLVVAMVIDSKTLRIVNAKQVEAKKSSGVETVTDYASDIKVFGGNGEVTIAGTYGNAAVYDVAGRLVATASGEASVNVPSGIYIVKVDNVAAKVVVR